MCYRNYFRLVTTVELTCPFKGPQSIFDKVVKFILVVAPFKTSFSVFLLKLFLLTLVDIKML